MKDLDIPRAGRGLRFAAARGLGVIGALALTIGSAIGAKQLQSRRHAAPLMAEVAQMPAPARDLITRELPAVSPVAHIIEDLPPEPEEEPEAHPAPLSIPPELLTYAADPNIRWFDGRPARPAKKVWMTVTGYSPDARSCGEFADGKTATLHSVKTNNMRLVAADPKVLPYGSMLTIPGYADQTIVPVLDCGGAIKGSRLDLLFPTHEAARQWGKKRILVTVWEYADGQPMRNPRTQR